MNRQQPLHLTILFTIIDLVVLILVYKLSYELRGWIREIYRLDLIPGNQNILMQLPKEMKYSIPLVFIIPWWFVSFWGMGVYKEMHRPMVHVFWRLVKASTIAALAVLLVSFSIAQIPQVSRSLLGIFWLISVPTLWALRFGYRAYLAYYYANPNTRTNVYIVGAYRTAANLIEEISSKKEWGVNLLGVFTIQPNDGDDELIPEVVKPHVIGSLDDLEAKLKDSPVDEVILASQDLSIQDIQEIIFLCEVYGKHSTLLATFLSSSIATPQISSLADTPAITFGTTSRSELSLGIKRMMDIFVSLIAIIILSPLMLTTALAIKLETKGPILFVQDRCGLNGRIIKFLKFRSMVFNAEEKKKELADENIMSGPVFKVKNDRRITKVGKIIRKLSIDELPQLFNVLIGDMSLVGPRPPIPSEVAEYKPWQRRRLSMRPGITCIWQVSGRNTISDFEEWVKLDLQYIDNWSLALDLKLLLLTIPAVISTRGAG